ncbi:MAG TPA: hypothetical protein VK420_08160, partial [Longimicrobium sp.]|nr:hypothetical protein [Longimicrobium sp.]
MSRTMPFRRFLLLALLAASAAVQSPAAAQTTMPPGVARPLPQRPQVQPSPGRVANQNRRKRESLTPAQRLARDFERGGVNAAYLGVMAHALDRALAGEAPASDLDRAVS